MRNGHAILMPRRSTWFALAGLLAFAVVGQGRNARAEGSSATVTEFSTNRSAISKSATAPTSTTDAANSISRASSSTTQAPAASSPPPIIPEAPSPSLAERAQSLWQWSFTTATELLFKRWDSPVFEPPFWSSTMAGIRILLPLALALVLLCNAVVQRAFGEVPRSLRDKTAVGFVIAGFLTYYHGFNPNVRNGGLYQVNAYYQQFFEAKYHAELDNTWLFDCTIAAEKQLGRSQQLAQRSVRSHVAPEEPRVAGLTLGIEAPDQCISRFSAPRWDAFKSDVAAFTKLVDAKVWSKLQAERRLVVTPTWLAVAPWLSPAAPSEMAFRWSAFFQLVFHAGTLVAVVLGFGVLPAAVTSIVWGCQPFMPFDGGVELFQSLWLEALICGLCALYKRQWALGVVAASLGVALQPVAVIVVLASSVVAARSFFADTKNRVAPPRVFGPGLVLCTGFWLALGCIGSSYSRYDSAREFQASVPYASDVGIGPLVATSAASRYSVVRQDALPDPARPWAQLRSERLSQTRLLAWGAWGAISLAVLALAWMHRSLWLSAALGLIPCTLLAQPIAGCIGLLALTACSYRRADLWPALLFATASSASLSGHAVFVDDRSTILSGLLVLTTVTLLVSLSPSWVRTRASTTRPLPSPESQLP